MLIMTHDSISKHIQIENTNFIIIFVLQPLLCTRWAKWTKRPPKVMRQRESSS